VNRVCGHHAALTDREGRDTKCPVSLEELKLGVGETAQNSDERKDVAFIYQCGHLMSRECFDMLPSDYDGAGELHALCPICRSSSWRIIPSRFIKLEEDTS